MLKNKNKINKIKLACHYLSVCHLGVVIVAANGPLLRLGETAVVTATVATGNDLVFDWDFSTPTKPIVTRSVARRQN